MLHIMDMAIGCLHIIVGNAEHTAQLITHGALGNAAHQGADGADGQVAAHGAVALNDGDLRASAGSRDSGANTGRAAADDGNVIAGDYFQFFCITNHRTKLLSNFRNIWAAVNNFKHANVSIYHPKTDVNGRKFTLFLFVKGGQKAP